VAPELINGEAVILMPYQLAGRGSVKTRQLEDIK
jgi:hypothetical protein